MKNWNKVFRDADDGEGGNGGDPLEPESIELSLADLPEEFKGRSPAEVKLILSRMPGLLEASQGRVQQLENAMTAPPAPAEPEPEPDPMEGKTFQERFEEDPEAAIVWKVEQQYGTSFAGVTDRLGANDLQHARTVHGDFAEHEEGILKTLKDMGAPVNAQNLQGAYELSRGRQVIEAEALALRESGGIIPTRPDPTPPTPTVELTDEEKMIADTLHIEHAEYARYKKPEEFKLKIPKSTGS